MPEGSYYVIPTVVRPFVCSSVRPLAISCVRNSYSFLWNFFSLAHNFQTIKAINSDLDTLIELFIEKCNAQEPKLCYLYLFDYCPLLNFILNFCLDHNFQSMKANNLKLHTLIEHMMENSSAQEPQL